MIYPICKLKNISGGVLQLHEHEFQIDEIFDIEDEKRMSWANNDATLLAITNQQIEVHNQLGVIEGISKQVDYLKNISVESPRMNDGRLIVRSDSRPINTETVFSGAGDSDTEIGKGKELRWDFSNDDDLYQGDEVPEGYKCKEILMKFLCPIYIKDGALYHFDSVWGSYANMQIAIPPNSYYPNPQGTIPASTLGLTGSQMYSFTEELLVYQEYVTKQFFYGTCPMGRELNSEGSAINALPPGWYIRVLVFVPESDNISKGFGSIEFYRCHSILLPGQTVENIH